MATLLLWIGILLLIAWVLGFLVFRVAGCLIHVLVVVGLILLVLWFFGIVV